MSKENERVLVQGLVLAVEKGEASSLCLSRLGPSEACMGMVM